MEGEEPEVESTEEITLPPPKVFIDLALENDIKGEELEWFKSKIVPQRVHRVKEKKTESGVPKVTVKFEQELEKSPENQNKIILRLTETDTIWFFSLETYFSQENEEDIEKALRENEAYEAKKVKKEIIRKRCMADAQTPRFLVKSRELSTSEIVMVDSQVLASEWDMYDTYKALDKCEKKTYKNGVYYVGKRNNGIKCSLHQIQKLNKPTVISWSPAEVPEYICKGFTMKLEATDDTISAESDIARTFGNLNFKYASLITERLLASNSLESKQSIFKKDFKTRYYTGPSEMSYKIDLLWCFEKDLERPLTVTDMDWNPVNEDILAVAYGDLNFEKGSSLGLICIWSAKNPRQPEREFWFEDSITSLHFSRLRPNTLAVGTRSGNVFVLDVSIKEGNRRILGRDCLKTHPGPVWKVEWFLHRELVFETEEILALGESGMLMVFSTSIDKDTKDILKLEYVTSTPKPPGKIPKKFDRSPVFITEIFYKKTYSGLSFSLYFDRKFCYIATKEGVVIKCNSRNPSMTDGVFLAHNGPVYTIQHSPVTDMFFLTCGADWKIKIWMEGITQPLITLQNKAPVICARWSPTLPTVIASVGESEFSMWDFGRNVLSPVAIKKFDDCKKSLSNFLFSSNGANVMVGCEEGLVRVLHLSELPRIPFLQVIIEIFPRLPEPKQNKLPCTRSAEKEALISAIRKDLRNKGELFLKFCKGLEANRDKLKTNVIENLKT